MSWQVRRRTVFVNATGRSPSGAIRVATGGWLLAVMVAPAHADTFDNTLFVNPLGRPGTVTVGTRIEVMKVEGAGVRLQWNLPALDTGRRPWQLRMGNRSFTCADDSAAAIPGAPSGVTGRSGQFDLILADYPSDASYYIRLCLPRSPSGYHMTNQVEIRLVTPVIEGRPVTALPPGSPQITGALAASPVRSRYTIGVTGQNFGERPGRLILQLGTSLRELTGLDWLPRAIAGRVPLIDSVPDGPAALIVERADGARSPPWSVNFVATREVRVVPGGQIVQDSCSNEADYNWCANGYAEPSSPSFNGYHSSIFVFDAAGETGFDQFSIPLLNGWRFHHLEYSHGNRAAPPSVSIIDRDSARPRIRVNWRNPSGHATINYGFRVYIIGPGGVPHR